jgi:hypothetical protein
MAEAEDDFEKARRAFRNASTAQTIVIMRKHAEQGMALLDRADALLAVVEHSPIRRVAGHND